MSVARLQDIRSILKNQSYFYIVSMNKKKTKIKSTITFIIVIKLKYVGINLRKYVSVY